MGNLFRRSTLAALGLDALDDVSEQSFEVIDRADAFVNRLLGSISGVLPKTQADRMGTRTTELVDHIFEACEFLGRMLERDGEVRLVVGIYGYFCRRGAGVDCEYLVCHGSVS